MRRVVWVLAFAALLFQPSTDAAAGQSTSKPAARGTTSPPAGQQAGAPKTSPGAGPVIVVQTAKGTFEFETYPAEAPKTVEHILALVKRNFYNGQRVHRVEPGFVVQFGDPASRDMTKRSSWGNGDSGRPIGVAEISPKHPHRLGAVGMAHSGDPRGADSQIYVTIGPATHLNGKYTVFGQVISGMDVVGKLQETDVIRRVTVREPGRGTK